MSGIRGRLEFYILNIQKNKMLYFSQKRSASPDVPMVEESQTMSEVDQLPSEQVAETFSEDNVNELDNNANQKTPGPVRRIIQETTTTTITTTTFDSPIPIIEKMEVERPEEAEDVIVIEAPEPVQPPIPSPKKERFTSPERYILLVKTPEALRKHRTLTIGEKDPTEVDTEEKIQYTRLETVKFKEVKEKVKYEEPVPKEKFILTMKTPEAIRRHHTFTIRDKSPEEMNKITKITKSQSDVHVSKRAAKKLVKQASEPERRDLFEEKEDVVPEPKFVIVMKTPECLRRHHTFTIGDRPKSPDYPYIEEGEITEPIATIGPPADRRKKEEAKERKKREWEEYETPPKEKFILTTTTPLAIRKYQTFVVEPKDEKTALPQSASADAVMLAKKGKVQRSESTDSKKHSYLRRLQFELFRGRSRERKSEKQEKRQKSLDERKPESAQKYILSTTTPIMMRKYQTFAIVDGGKSRDIGADTNLQSIASAYQQKDMSFDEEKTTSPVRTSDFYSITATTPLAKRRVVVEGMHILLYFDGSYRGGLHFYQKTFNSQNTEK